jgi:hypothetical protein
VGLLWHYSGARAANHVVTPPTDTGAPMADEFEVTGQNAAALFSLKIHRGGGIAPPRRQYWLRHSALAESGARD